MYTFTNLGNESVYLKYGLNMYKGKSDHDVAEILMGRLVDSKDADEYIEFLRETMVTIQDEISTMIDDFFKFYRENQIGFVKTIHVTVSDVAATLGLSMVAMCLNELCDAGYDMGMIFYKDCNVIFHFGKSFYTDIMIRDIEKFREVIPHVLFDVSCDNYFCLPVKDKPGYHNKYEFDDTGVYVNSVDYYIKD